MQHLDASAQVAIKQRALEDALWHIGKVRAETVLPPVQGPAWEYRHRARLAVRDVAKKGGVLVGFHERRSSFVADMTSCEVVPRRISDLLVPLRRLVESLTIRDRLPQIELAIGDRDGGIPIDVLVLRILEPLQPEDIDKLRAFADTHRVQFYVQPGGPDTARPLYPEAETLAYTLPEFEVTLPFKPTEFTQVNAAINRVMVRRAIALLDPRPGERIGDLFCGLGNFTLPIARRGAFAIGIEGSAGLVERARANALLNGLAARTEFHAANLFEADAARFAAWGPFDKLLVDPPREGAIEAVKALPEGVRRIVYVSCNPATLARDAGVLVSQRGYRLRAAGVINMFPHTAHVESIAVFEQ
jgi:23S rRNA (uracil1939-C5)-methyltransferase